VDPGVHCVIHGTRRAHHHDLLVRGGVEGAGEAIGGHQLARPGDEAVESGQFGGEGLQLGLERGDEEFHASILPGTDWKPTKEATVTMQQQIAEDLGVKPDIDPASEIEARIVFLVDYLRTTGAKGYVLGISGGQDSTLAGRLAQLAVERVRAEGGEAQFLAVRLPYRVQKDAADAESAIDFVAADRSLTVNIEYGVD